MIVILELRHWQELVPVILPFIDENPEVLFQFLVNPFCLSICLRVIGSGCR
jgi:hypothetical protein